MLIMKNKNKANIPTLWRRVRIVDTKEITYAIRLTNGYWLLQNGTRIPFIKAKPHISMKQKTKTALQISGISFCILLAGMAESLLIAALIVAIMFFLDYLTN
jgi:hypothetical protein